MTASTHACDLQYAIRAVTIRCIGTKTQTHLPVDSVTVGLSTNKITEGKRRHSHTQRMVKNSTPFTRRATSSITDDNDSIPTFRNKTGSVSGHLPVRPSSRRQGDSKGDFAASA